MSTTVRPLRPADDRTSFRSGNADLDRFFVSYAGQNQFRHNIGVTYVAIEGERLLGFVTVAASEISGDALPEGTRRGLPQYPLPVLRLARLAVDKSAAGRGTGRRLVRHVLGMALRMADDIGCVGVVVDAKPEAVAFYERLGFHKQDVVIGASGDRPEPHPMFLPLSAIAMT